MDIKPWNRDVQSIGEELNHIWNECEGHFLAIFRDNAVTVDEHIDDAHIHTALSFTLANCIIGKEESIDRYFKHSDSVIRLLIAQYDQPVCNFLSAHRCSTLRNVLNVDNLINII